ncbi:hypothetical protein [Rhodosalinus sediminis]|uniref:hypothetical protein n=1 Tax=Rhodosalinus sediminis TaxID=1940533 RepID=UPI0023579035|nr:hypothetical protein [Rhodosalinus sediminis]
MYGEWSGIVLSFLGVALGAVSVILTHITFFAPNYWLKFALKNPQKWNRVATPKQDRELYRHALLSGFSIDCLCAEPVVDGFYESWMEGVYRPDPHSASYYVVLNLNGLPILTELFVSFDGSRNFIPAPTHQKDGRLVRYVFREEQRLLAKIVGRAHLESTVEELLNKISSTTYSATLLDEPHSKSGSIDELEKRIESAKDRLTNPKVRISTSAVYPPTSKPA